MRFLAWLSRFRPTKSLGDRGEEAAARYLRGRGYKIVARHDRAVLGELDIVAVDGRTVVFVEVKTRASQEAGHPAEAVDRDKQHRLSRMALAYLRRHELLECASRFDVVAVTWPPGTQTPAIEHIAGAFKAAGPGSMYN